MTAKKIDIRTRDGVCPSYVYRPSGKGPWRAVLVFMDGIGMREAMLEIGETLATKGYFVLLPDLYYRSGRYAPMNAKTVFVDPAQRKTLSEKFMAHATAANLMSDTRAFLDYLAHEPDANKGPVGITGYCLGGRMALLAAGTYPDRFAACASFHGGRMATDEPDSPHLLAPKITAKVLVAGAVEDSSFTDEMKARLDDALTKAGVDHRVETWPAKHGWVLRDTPAFDAAQCDRHWTELGALLGATLPASAAERQ